MSYYILLINIIFINNIRKNFSHLVKFFLKYGILLIYLLLCDINDYCTVWVETYEEDFKLWI